MANKNARQGPGAKADSHGRYFPRFADIKQRARHQWPAILAGLGIDDAYLKKRHGPCPACAGRDRFRFDDKNGDGGYHCNQCGAGDGFSLLEKAHDWTAQEALQAVARWLGLSTYGPTATPSRKPAAPATAPAPATVERMQVKIKVIWTDALPLDHPKAEPARAYLEHRGLGGLTPFPHYFRLHPALPYWTPGPDNTPVELARYPALVALALDTNGKVKGMHRTYLAPDGQGKAHPQSPSGEPLPAKKLLSLAPGATRGAAIRLYPVGDDNRLAVAEGIETALAVRAATGWPCWAAMFAGNLAMLELPADIGTVAIMADNDRHQAGQRAAKALARSLLRRIAPPVVKLLIPEDIGDDWLDVHRRQQEEGAQHG